LGAAISLSQKAPQNTHFCPFLGLREGLLRATPAQKSVGVEYSRVLPLGMVKAPQRSHKLKQEGRNGPKSCRNGPFGGCNFSKSRKWSHFCPFLGLKEGSNIIKHPNSFSEVIFFKNRSVWSRCTNGAHDFFHGAQRCTDGAQGCQAIKRKSLDSIFFFIRCAPLCTVVHRGKTLNRACAPFVHRGNFAKNDFQRVNAP